MWMWSTQAVPSMTSIPLYSQSSLKILPMSRFNLPYTTLLLFLGTHTIWYLHSHTVCANFFSSFAPFEFRSQNQHCFLNSKELFLKYYSIAFAILPSTAGGLALELVSEHSTLGKWGLRKVIRLTWAHFHGQWLLPFPPRTPPSPSNSYILYPTSNWMLFR